MNMHDKCPTEEIILALLPENQVFFIAFFMPIGIIQ